MQALSPFTLLLNSQKTQNNVQKRSEEETLLLQELIQNNKLFAEFGISPSTIKCSPHAYPEICNRIVLIWAENPHINEINNN